MALDSGLLIVIAEIAGVFVGFGALIGVTRRNEVEVSQLIRIRGVGCSHEGVCAYFE